MQIKIQKKKKMAFLSILIPISSPFAQFFTDIMFSPHLRKYKCTSRHLSLSARDKRRDARAQGRIFL